MELWIRSQDKKQLINSSYIEYGEWNKENRIYVSGEVVGKYKTKERALELLDEIQETIENIGKKNALTDKNGIIIGIEEYKNVFDMPKE